LSAAWTIQRRMVGRIGMDVTRSCRGVIKLISQKCCGKLNRNQKHYPLNQRDWSASRQDHTQKVSVPAVVHRARLTTWA